jgi:hypothetical protein
MRTLKPPRAAEVLLSVAAHIASANAAGVVV